ncbi:MAG: hypothetical protein IJC76_09195 [Lachnospiraceae bacterium]|nr:hypothetical protein [Lachnospiraceae bacterium]
MVAPKKTQGMCFYKTFDNVYLAFSASWGRLEIKIGEAYRTITLPSMIEQISINGVFMYCVFESAAKEYVADSVSPIQSYCVFSVNTIFK